MFENKTVFNRYQGKPLTIFKMASKTPTAGSSTLTDSSDSSDVEEIDSNETYDPELDICSPLFNPLKALYSKDLKSTASDQSLASEKSTTKPEIEHKIKCSGSASSSRAGIVIESGRYISNI